MGKVPCTKLKLFLISLSRTMANAPPKKSLKTTSIQHEIQRRIYDPMVYGTEVKDEPSRSFRVLASDPGVLIININGFCIDKGLPSAISAYGAFWATTSDQNTGVATPPKEPQTFRYAMLYGIQVTLEKFLEHMEIASFNRPDDMSRIVFAVSSKWVVETVSEQACAWAAADWKDLLGYLGPYEATLKRIYEATVNFQSRGVEINFWEVPKEENLDAEKLAKKAVR